MSERDIRNAAHAEMVAKAGGEAQFERRSMLMIQALRGVDPEVGLYMLRFFTGLIEAGRDVTPEQFRADVMRLIHRRIRNQ